MIWGTGVVNPVLDFPALKPPFENSPWHMTVSGSQIVFTLIDVAYSINPFAYVNYLISDLTKPLTSAAVDLFTTVPAFTNANLQLLPGNNLLVNFIDLGNGFTIPANSKVIIDLITAGASIPEPASLALLAMGMVGCLASGHRQKIESPQSTWRERRVLRHL